jgi:hypothetical protein
MAIESLATLVPDPSALRSVGIDPCAPQCRWKLKDGSTGWASLAVEHRARHLWLPPAVGPAVTSDGAPGVRVQRALTIGDIA